MSHFLDDYEPVEERLAKFWALYPDGRVETELIEATANRFIVYSKIYRTEVDPKPWATGLAFETISDRGVNATSALENAETSSLGRCLANAGFASKGKRPSREEMSKATRDRIIRVEKPSDPWTIEPKEMPIPVAEAVADLNDGIVPEQIPTCKHGTMMLKTGNKNGKEWRGYVCSTWPPDPNGKCPAVWMEIDKSGRWVPQRPKVEQSELA